MAARIIFALASLHVGVEALMGFDCGGRHLNSTTISLLDTGECNVDPKPSTSTRTYIQLLQLAEYQHADVFQCKVEISRTIYYCGMHSHVSVVHNGQYEYLLDVSRKACLQMHQDGTLSLGQGAYITGLRKNQTDTRSITLAGKIGQGGDCSGTQFSDPYGTWDGVVVQAVAKITLQTGTASVKLAAGKIVLKSGTTCALRDGSCVDLYDGYTFWSPMPIPTCNFDQYDVLYEGHATRIQENGEETPALYSLTTQDVTFALTKTSEQQLCGYTLLRTEHPKLFVLESPKGDMFKARTRIPVENLDIFTYMNSKFVYVERHIRNQMATLYHDVMRQKCNLEKQVIKNALAFGTLLPDEFAYVLTKQPGYMAVSAGEVAHIIKCVPVEVTLRRSKDCYTELPVTHRNRSLFLTPKSRILTKAGTQRECNTILPVMYQIEGAWYRFAPYPIENIAPEIIQPLTQPAWKYLTPGRLATSGIYTENDIEALRDHIMFPAERPAVLNMLARGVAGQSNPQGSVSMMGLLDEDTLAQIARTTAEKMWGGLTTFGSATAGIIGIFLIVRFIKLVVDTLIQGYALHSMYGWSLHLLGAVWSSITNLLLHLGRRRTPNPTTEDDGLQSIEVPNKNPPAATPRQPAATSHEDVREAVARIERIRI